MIIPNMWKNKMCFKPPTSIHLTLYAPFVHMTHVSTGQTNGISIDLPHARHSTGLQERSPDASLEASASP